MLRQLGADRYEDLVVLAVIVALLMNIFFLFKVVPWSRPGSWRRIWILAAVASGMFIVSEAAILTDDALVALDISHQVPLFAALLAGASGFFLVYTDAYRSAERSRVLALTDPLTELANRRAFEERLKLSFERHEPFALLYVDLDGFKQINDRHGHAVGDGVLRAAAERLKHALAHEDLVARIGGDEFIVVLDGVDAADKALAVADRLIEDLSLPIVLDGGSHCIGVSIGIALARHHGEAQPLVEAADAAMYRAKQAGRGRAVVAGQG